MANDIPDYMRGFDINEDWGFTAVPDKPSDTPSIDPEKIDTTNVEVAKVKQGVDDVKSMMNEIMNIVAENKQKAETDFDVSDLSEQNRRVVDAIAESEKMDSRGRMDLLSRVSEDLRNSIDEVESERRSLMALMGELNRKIISTTQEADCTYHERRLLHHILHNRDYTIEGAAASLGLREAEVRIILESLQHRGLTQ